MIPEHLSKKTSDEAGDFANKIGWPKGWPEHNIVLKSYTAAATSILSNPGEWNLAPVDKVGELVKALKIIAEWKLPETGQFWDDDKERPMSYGACYGSNGERDYMKMIATKALKQYKQ